MKKQKTVSIISAVISVICLIILAADLKWHIDLNKQITNFCETHKEIKTQPKPPKFKLIMESKNKYFETTLQPSYPVTLNDGTNIRIIVQ